MKTMLRKTHFALVIIVLLALYLAIAPTGQKQALLAQTLVQPIGTEQGIPVYDVAQFSSLANAVTALGTADVILLIASAQPVQQSITIPASIKLRFADNGSLTTIAGVSVTIQGLVSAGAERIFTGAGSIIITSAEVKALPQWWGAAGDGVTDDTRSIQIAINSARNIFFPAGTYVLGQITQGRNYLENRLLMLRSGITVSGTGETSVIKLRDHLLDNPDDSISNAHMMMGYDVSNLTIQKLKFDMNGANNLTPAGKIRNAMAIFIMGGSKAVIKNCLFTNCAGRNVITLRESQTGQQSSNSYIGDNVFKNGGRYVGTPKANVNNTDFSFLYVLWDGSIIERNVISQEDIKIGLSNYSGGIEIHGSKIRVTNNRIVGCDPAMYVATDRVSELKDIVISGNSMLNCLRGITFFLVKGPAKQIQIVRNNIVLIWPSSRPSGYCFGIQVPHGGQAIFDGSHANASYVDNLNFNFNNISNNLTATAGRQCIGLELHSLHNSTLRGNTIKGLTGPGFRFLGSPWGSINVSISENTIVDNGRAASIDGYKTGIFFNHDGSALVPLLAFFAKNISISNNVLGNSEISETQRHGISILNIASTQIESLNIASNKFVNVKSKLFDGKTDIDNLGDLNPQARFVP